MAARRGLKDRWGVEWGVLLGFGRSGQLSQNKFLDPSTPSLRKVDDGEKIRKKKRKEEEEKKECCL